MRRNFLKGIVCLFMVGICAAGWIFLAKAVEKSETVAANNDFIRLHVLANSDSPQDQRLKLLVRDSLIKYLEPLIGNEVDKEKVKNIILHNKMNLIKVATETMLRQGLYYPVDIEYGIFEFPLKSYGELVVPPGEYEAVRVLIGDAKGANWWCVLFPPLCFVDETKVVQVSEDETVSDGIEQVEHNLAFRYKIIELMKNL